MKVIGKIIGINTSDGGINLSVVNQKSEQLNIKTKDIQNFSVGHVYQFDVEISYGERTSYILKEYKSVALEENAFEIYKDFFPSAPMDATSTKKIIYHALDQIKNPCIRNITEVMLKQYGDKFFLFPAATRMHHAYVGGLAYHTVGMLKLADSFLVNYPYLKKDYLYAGIILHDIGKTVELTGVESTEYSLDGQLLGHLVIGALEIHKIANELGYQNNQEVKLLEHMLISHHGQPLYGAAKRPMTPEAIALWYIDTIDSKFRVLGEELGKTEHNAFTDTIGVLDKIKVYKE
ncbi:MAG: HD domain-containing protein [Anaeroplasmataceae bacterium]|nr:HD domain-containing protein [Anaeroplasmataceae bacterium]